MRMMILAFLVSSVTAFAWFFVLAPSNPSSISPQSSETAYDRVIKTGELKCGIMPWAPYWIVDPNTNKLSGMAKDFFDDLAKSAALKIIYIPITFGNQSLELASGRIDAVCNDGPWIAASAKVVAFTVPFYFTPMHLYVRADDQRFKDIGDLNQPEVSLVALEGDSSLELAERLFPLANIRTIPATSDAAQQILDVVTRKADSTIIDGLAASTYNHNNPDKMIRRLHSQPIAVYPGGMSVLPNEAKLLQFLSTLINSANYTGLTENVLEHYDPTGDVVLRVEKTYVAPILQDNIIRKDEPIAK